MAATELVDRPSQGLVGRSRCVGRLSRAAPRRSCVADARGVEAAHSRASTACCRGSAGSTPSSGGSGSRSVTARCPTGRPPQPAADVRPFRRGRHLHLDHPGPRSRSRLPDRPRVRTVGARSVAGAVGIGSSKHSAADRSHRRQDAATRRPAPNRSGRSVPASTMAQAISWVAGSGDASQIREATQVHGGGTPGNGSCRTSIARRRAFPLRPGCGMHARMTPEQAPVAIRPDGIDPQIRPLFDAGSIGSPSSRQFLDALGVAVYTTDAAGRITFYNEAAAALLGAPPRRSARSGVARGSCFGRTAGRCPTTSARWPSR